MAVVGQAFTTKYRQRVNVLASEVSVSSDFDGALLANPQQHPPKVKCLAIWDTGATHSVITTKIVTTLSLKPVGMAQSHGVHGPQIVNRYMVSIWLPNNVVAQQTLVTEAPGLQGADALIGMDIIGAGDFAVSLENGNTVFSFRIPHSGRPVDFLADTVAPNRPAGAPVGKRPGPNEPCWCGSGKKYKKCHQSEDERRRLLG